MTPKDLVPRLRTVIGIVKHNTANAKTPPNPLFRSSVVPGLNPVAMPERTFADRAMVLTVTVAVPE